MPEDETITVTVVVDDKASDGLNRIGDAVKGTTLQVKGLETSTISANTSSLNWISTFRSLERSMMTSHSLLVKYRGEHDALAVSMGHATDIGMGMVAILRVIQVAERSAAAATMAETGAQMALNVAMTMGAALVLVPAIIATFAAIQGAFTAQKGANFVAQGDTGLMVHKGEHVRVTPAPGGGEAASGGSYNFTTIIQGDATNEALRKHTEAVRDNMIRYGVKIQGGE
jgi:hypothetical protein